MAAVFLAALGGVPVLAAAEGAQSGSSPLADDPTMIALAVALACADAPDAIEAPPAEPSGSGHESEGPELELVATVRAKALRFEDVPKVDVAFNGTGKRKTVWKTERVNLPARPEPGVTYRDVQVRLTITTNFEELGSMLQQAKRASRGIRVEQDGPPASAKAAAPAKPAAPLASGPAKPVVSPPAPLASAQNVAPVVSAPAPAASPANAAPAASPAVPVAPAAPAAPRAAPATSPAAPAALPAPAKAAPPPSEAAPPARVPTNGIPPASPAAPAPVVPAR